LVFSLLEQSKCVVELLAGGVTASFIVGFCLGAKIVKPLGAKLDVREPHS
jgi:hypothetical protein